MQVKEVYKEPREGKALITNITANYDAFGTFDDGLQIYVPPNVARASNLVPGEYRNVKAIQNIQDHADRTPWMCIFIEPVDAYISEYLEQTKSMSDTKAHIVTVLENSNFTYLTTSEIAAEINKDVTSTRNILNAMFQAKKVAKADVYSQPSQKRASFTLWAISASEFMNT